MRVNLVLHEWEVYMKVLGLMASMMVGIEGSIGCALDMVDVYTIIPATLVFCFTT